MITLDDLIAANEIALKMMHTPNFDQAFSHSEDLLFRYNEQEGTQGVDIYQHLSIEWRKKRDLQH